MRRNNKTIERKLNYVCGQKGRKLKRSAKEWKPKKMVFQGRESSQ